MVRLSTIHALPDHSRDSASFPLHLANTVLQPLDKILIAKPVRSTRPE
jgi:hypothetical protein